MRRPASELSQCQVKDGATLVLGRSYARDHLEVPLRRTDNLNLTGITDQVTAANSALPRLARLPPALARPRLRLPQPEMPLPD